MFTRARLLSGSASSLMQGDAFLFMQEGADNRLAIARVNFGLLLVDCCVSYEVRPAVFRDAPSCNEARKVVMVRAKDGG